MPYRGAGQAVTDLLAGHVKSAFLGPTSMIPHWKAGKLKFLAQTSAKRAPTLLEVPTMEDAGYKGLVLEAWYAAFAPVGTPPELVKTLNAAIEKSLTDQNLQANFVKGSLKVSRRHARETRQASQGGFDQIRAAGEGAEYQRDLIATGADKRAVIPCL